MKTINNNIDYNLVIIISENLRINQGEYWNINITERINIDCVLL